MQKIYAKLNNYQKETLRLISSGANALGIKVYLVGGSVRDLLLGRKCSDFDLAVEGNALDFALFMQKQLGGKLDLYPNFSNAKLSLAKNVSFDFVSTRKESYPSPGKLPQIEQGDILDDLQRRDFTINAIGVNINNLEDGEILDPFSGLKDISQRTIRVIHKKSYIDDPTRILRAVRYSIRLGFTIAENDKELINFSKYNLKEVSAARLKKEFIKICSEKDPFANLKLLSYLGVLPYFLPGINIDKVAKIPFVDFKRNIKIEKNLAVWLIIILYIYLKFSQNTADIYKVNFSFTKKEMLCIQWLRENFFLVNDIIEKRKKLSFPIMHKLLFKMPVEIERLLLLVLNTEGLSLKDLSKVRKGSLSPLNGHDLIARGFPKGHIVGEILFKLKGEVWEGKINSRQDALLWLEKVRNKYGK